MMRYFVQSEHVRGEKRIYFVCDKTKITRHGDGQISDHTTDKRKAERWCGELNDPANQQKRNTHG